MRGPGQGGGLNPHVCAPHAQHHGPGRPSGLGEVKPETRQFALPPIRLPGVSLRVPQYPRPLPLPPSQHWSPNNLGPTLWGKTALRRRGHAPLSLPRAPSRPPRGASNRGARLVLRARTQGRARGWGALRSQDTATIYPARVLNRAWPFGHWDPTRLATPWPLSARSGPCSELGQRPVSSAVRGTAGSRSGADTSSLGP